jgi:hypothetical protein
MDFLELTSQLQHLLVEAKTIPNNLKGWYTIYQTFSREQPWIYLNY